ncbi:MAG: WGR domain-containing protein [Gammaproteobacteria bacterium]
MRIYLQIAAADDKPPRYYSLHLQQDLLGGWTVIKEWGYQGMPSKSRREHFADLDAAQQALIQARDAQLRRGYRVVFVQGQEKPS